MPIDETESQSLISLKHVLNYIKKQEKYSLKKKARSKRALLRRKYSRCTLRRAPRRYWLDNFSLFGGQAL